MKYKYIIPLLMFSSMVYAQDGPKLTDRDSLKFIFGKSYESVNASLTEYDFFIHLKGLDYALINTTDQSEVEWTSPNPELNGKVVMLSTKQEKDTVCKNFMEILIIKDKKYEGDAIVCLKDNQWVIRK
ncbi:MAG TPA: hypothetical protein VIY47_17045 [Ignavibacteriaceae bacterium]